MKNIYTVGGVSFPSVPIMIGAGVCKTIEKTREWLPYVATVSGTYPRSQDLHSIHEQFALLAQEMASLPGDMPLIVSVGGDTPQQYLAGIEVFSAVPRVVAIELNLSRTGKGNTRILSFDVPKLEALLSSITLTHTKPIWLKVSPYSDPMLLKEVAGLFNEYRHVIRAVVSCNMFPNSYDASGALVDLSGPALRAIALGQVAQFRRYLHETIDVIGSGGITTSSDIAMFIKAGAKAVQLTSLPLRLGNPTEFWSKLSDATRGF